MHKLDLQNLLDIAKEASLLSGARILEIYGSDNFDVELKGDNSPLTIADKEAHDIICSFLEPTNIPILSEEGSKISYDERRDWDYFWLVDPLDGTKEFIKRNGEFTVNIALIKGDQPIMGVVYAPVLNWLYWGIKGESAFKEDKSGVRTIHTAATDLGAKNLKVVASRSHLNEETEKFLSSLDDPEIVSMGSSLKFLLVAENKANVYPRYAPTMEWDTGAAHAIVLAAGGKMYKEPGREPFVYNKENLLNPHFLVVG
ncbi:MAG: 3'(2'),5'-bisphosphate nucleotidase CysQ [Bacteroidetes bacterium]|nr:3'(2'),5'-bisphosphate nucleotidase CysQ [Bacteroidota bacterium]MDA1119330.1 3'(2'),5'-bisphosphate nucleotidase CysQ [Bacteroidota bacterium]